MHLNSKVYILQNSIPDYRIPFFEHLIREGLKSGVCYTIASSTPKGALTGLISDQFFQSYKEISCKTVKILGRKFVFYTPSELDEGADLLIAEQALGNTIVYRWLISRSINRFAFWGHGKTVVKQRSRFSSYLEIRLLNRCDWFFGYTEIGAKAAIESGFPMNRVTVVQNSTDTKVLRDKIEKLSNQEVAQFLVNLDLGRGKYGVFIGALDVSKRIDFLIESAEMIQREIPEFRLLIFGDGPLQDYVKVAALNRTCIRYFGRADLMTKALISQIAEIIMMPGRVGLIAVESFALGLPIVTTNWKFHAPEFDYLRNGIDAVVTDNNVNDYAARIIAVLKDENLLLALKLETSRRSTVFNIELMAKNFNSGVRNSLATLPRS
jgi:glycosyltransferase involved in cell wall biosynthesis